MKTAINYTLTEHSSTRCAQRALGVEIVDFLMLYGDVFEQKGGTYLLALNNDVRKRLKKDIKRLSRCLDNPVAPAAVIGEEGRVITLERRHKTIRHIQRY